MTVPNNTTLSHYRILSKLGEGGMGEVYLADDTRLRRKVALKVLPRVVASDPDRLLRFEREAFAASALNHPNILTIFEFGRDDSTNFLASEFVEGESLRERMSQSPLALTETLEIVIQIASALQAAHDAGIIHRDIKPENIMIRADGYVKVLDFGLAKLIERRGEVGPAIQGDEDPTIALSSRPIVPPSLTTPGLIMGTVAYMSPEQARGHEVDKQTDIWSLGCVLYEMLTRQQPFRGETTTDALANIIHTEPTSIRTLRRDATAELERIIARSLKKNKTERYQTADELLVDLKQLLRRLQFEAELERTSSTDRSGEQQTQIIGPQTTASPETRNSIAVLPFSNLSADADNEYFCDGATEPANNHPAPTKTKFNKLILPSLVVIAVIATFFAYNYFSSNKTIQSIAVMPFVNESGNADVDYLSDGMTETLIKSLSQLPNLNVKARSSVFRYKGKEINPQTIAKELNVQAILNGRVVQRDDQVTLSLELIDAQTENVIWTEQYNRKQTDLVALQSEIARDVSSQLRTKLSGADEQKVTRSYTASSEAYQLYLKGRYHWNKRTYEDLQKAIEHFKAAVAKDDRFALAYSGLADSYSILPYYTGSKSSDFNGQARPYAIRAVEIDDQLAETHTSLAFVNEGSWKWAEAEKEYKRAIELNPDYPTALMRYARFEVRVPGRDAEGLARIKRALELEPSSLVVNDNLSQIYLSQGSVDLAVEQAKRTVELDPAFSFGLLDLAYAQAKKGQRVEAVASAQRVVDVTKRASRALVCMGVIEALSGGRDEAMTILKELEEKYGRRQSDATEVAAIYASLGQKDEAFEWLEKAFQDHSSLLVDLRVEFPFASLQDDPRFKDLRRRMGMPQ